jgi:hypothetical protein
MVSKQHDFVSLEEIARSGEPFAFSQRSQEQGTTSQKAAGRRWPTGSKQKERLC